MLYNGNYKFVTESVIKTSKKKYMTLYVFVDLLTGDKFIKLKTS